MGVDWGALGPLWESTGVLWGLYGGPLGRSGVSMGVGWGALDLPRAPLLPSVETSPHQKQDLLGLNWPES